MGKQMTDQQKLDFERIRCLALRETIEKIISRLSEKKDLDSLVGYCEGAIFCDNLARVKNV